MAIDPNFSNVVLLCHFDGPNGSLALADNSSFARTITNASLPLLTSQYKYGTASLDHGTSAGAATCADSADWDFGSGQFTVECWVRISTAISGQRTVVGQWGSSNLNWSLGFNGTTLQFLYSTTGANSFTVSGTYSPPLNTWVHIAADRDASNVVRVYADGVVVASATVALTFFNSTSLFYISNDATNSRGFIGLIDDLRVTKGVARYAGAFTPPTEAFPDSDHYSTLVAQGLVRETIGASEGVLQVRGLVREVIGAPGVGSNQLLVQGLVREVVGVPGTVGGSGPKQYAVTMVT